MYIHIRTAHGFGVRKSLPSEMKNKNVTKELIRKCYYIALKTCTRMQQRPNAKLMPALGRLGQQDCCESQVILGYILSVRTALATE